MLIVEVVSSVEAVVVVVRGVEEEEGKLVGVGLHGAVEQIALGGHWRHAHSWALGPYCISD